MHRILTWPILMVGVFAYAHPPFCLDALVMGLYVGAMRAEAMRHPQA